MAITSTNEITAPVNVVLQNQLIRVARANCPYFIGSEASEIMEHSGSFTAKWRDVPNLTPTTTPLAELTGSLAFPTRAASQMSVTDITATVQKYGDFIYVNEEVDLLNPTFVTDSFTDRLGIQAGRSLNRLQRNELEDNATARYGNSVAGDSSVITTIEDNDVNFVMNSLLRNDAHTFSATTTGSQNIGTQPILRSLWAICHHDVAYDVAALTDYKSVETYAGQIQTVPFEMGMVMRAGVGLRFIATSEASIDVDSGGDKTTANPDLRSAAGTSADLYSVPVFGKYFHGSVGLGTEHIKEVYMAGDRLPAVQMMAHAKGSAGAGDPLNEMASLGWKSWHAAKILKSEWGYQIRVGATDLDI